MVLGKKAIVREPEQPDFSEIASVARCLRILEILVEHPEGLAVGELSLQSGYGKSSVSRILTSLEAAGYANRDPDSGRFALSFHFVGLAFRYMGAMDIPEFAVPILRRLAEQFDELVEVAIVERDHLEFVAMVNGRQRLQLRPPMGYSNVLHATAGGRAWLAFLDDAAIDYLIEKHGTRQFNDRTITDRAELKAELERVRAQGYALSRGEVYPEASAIAAPIRPAHLNGEAVGIVGLAFPDFRFSDERVRETAPAVIDAANELAKVWPLHLTFPHPRLQIRR